MSESSGRWLTIEECDNRVVVSARANPHDLADSDLPLLAEEIAVEMCRLPAGKPVVLAGNWPLWAIARVSRLAHPLAAWIGAQYMGAVIVVRAGQEAGRPVALASVREGAYAGAGPCQLSFEQTSARGVYRLNVAHPTPGRPIDGHTTVDINAVRAAIENLRPPSDLAGVLITGNAWLVVIAMLANSPALRPAQWCAVDEPRREYAVMSWGTHKGGKEIPGALVPRDNFIRPVKIKHGPLLRRLRRQWVSLPIGPKIMLIGVLIGLCGTIYATTLPVLVDLLKQTPTPVATSTVTSTVTVVPTLTATFVLVETVTP